MFRVDYKFSFDLLTAGRSEQEKASAIDIAWLIARMRNDNWLSVYFRIPMSREVQERKVLGLRMSGKLSSKAQRKTRTVEISRKEFHQILKKASQPIKKQPHEKEQS